MKNFTFPLVKIPQETQTTLFLIAEELKSRKLFRILRKAGITDCAFQPHLDSLILQSLGLDDGKDKTFEVYEDIMEKRSKKIEALDDSVMKQALKAYMELMREKKNGSNAHTGVPGMDSGKDLRG